MKTQRIKVKKGETVELYIAKRSQSCQYYSSVGNATDGMPDPVQRRVNSGMKATMVLVGPVSLCMVTKKTKVRP